MPIGEDWRPAEVAYDSDGLPLRVGDQAVRREAGKQPIFFEIIHIEAKLERLWNATGKSCVERQRVHGLCAEGGRWLRKTFNAQDVTKDL